MNLRRVLTILFVAALLVCISIVGFINVRRPTLVTLKYNMFKVQSAVEGFRMWTGGYCPADINTTVKEVLHDLGDTSDNEYSIAGAKGINSVRGTDIGSTGPALLVSFRNPFSRRTEALTMSLTDRPAWSSRVSGTVFYVPKGIKGKTATGYRIYGAGKDGLLDLVLSSGE